jgi:polyhydroxyalkanoate synthase
MNPLPSAFSWPMDPFDLMSSFKALADSWLKDPWGSNQRLLELCSRLNEAATGEVNAFLSRRDGGDGAGRLEGEILEYAHLASGLARKSYSLYSGWVRSWIATAGDLEPKEKRALAFWADQHLKALAPANFFWTNPSAVKKCLDTRGGSVNNGVRNWVKDLTRNDFSIQSCDLDAYKVGENLATTQGAVVYRNRLVEVIQYPAVGPKAYAVPIVFIQPWINKYYIFDLDEQKSFVRYLSQQGFTTFITSWKNPTPDMRGVTFEDYIRDGALKAIEAARDICHSETVHAAGYCIGGTALTALMAALSNADPETMPTVDWTLFSTLVDFADTGSLGVFISEKIIQVVESLMQRDGYLDGRFMGVVFNTLKSDSQIWWHYARNYLQGETPSPSDFLFWNHDRTRLPEAMASFYLRECCLENKLVQPDRLALCDQPIDLGRIRQPLYAVCGMEDHICLWKGTFAICRNVGGPVRYVLASGGHITGIVNPPSATSKKKFWAGDATRAENGDQWLAKTPDRVGSWWEDWVAWLTANSSTKRAAPPPVGSRRYPPLDQAPGRYVLEK